MTGLQSFDRSESTPGGNMHEQRPILIPVLGLLTQCAKNPEPAPAQSPTMVTTGPTTPAAPQPMASVATAAPASAIAPAPAPVGYSMCAGQHLPRTSPPSRSGAVSVQLAPAFLDEMTSCRAEDSMSKDLPGRAGSGSIDEKGNCVFASVGVSCHYHSGSEFITSSTKTQPPGQGEVHCIVPSTDPKSPSVFGAHVVCSDSSRNKPARGHEAEQAETGARCSAALLTELASCQGAKCCDDGTLTNAIGDLTREGRNDVRPDFRICEQTLKIDCSMLEHMTAHTATAPALGGVGKPVFGVARL
jgi:hypothetical protein